MQFQLLTLIMIYNLTISDLPLWGVCGYVFYCTSIPNKWYQSEFSPNKWYYSLLRSRRSRSV